MKLSLKPLLLKVIRRSGLPSHLTRLRRFWCEANLPEALTVGVGTIIEPPFYNGHPEHICIGNHCHIGRGCDFGVIQDFDTSCVGKIKIGDRVRITQGLQIYSLKSVVIEDDVLLASHVFVVDCSHGYRRPDQPYQHQNFESVASVKIGRGSWIGQNAVILQGVTIGEMCIVGANSVVTADIPPYSIAIGSPARVVKTWDPASGTWKRMG